VFGLSAAALRQAQGDPTLKSQLHVKQQLGTSWLGMNNAVKPFNNIKVREAFSDAIDRKSLITVALDGLGHPTGTFLPPGLPGAIANTPAASKYGGYDVTKAQALLAAAGYPGGKGFPAVTIDTDNVSTDETVMQYVQAELEQNLHITIGIKSMPQNAFNALFNSPKTAPPLYSYAFSLDYPDAQEMLQYFATSGPNGFVNYEHYSNPAFDNLVNRAVATANDSKRAALYNQAETLFMSAQPVVRSITSRSRGSRSRTRVGSARLRSTWPSGISARWQAWAGSPATRGFSLTDGARERGFSVRFG